MELFLHENKIPFPLFAVFHHMLEGGTVVIGYRHGSVDVCCENENVVSLCIFAADTDLTFYGLLHLIVGRVATYITAVFIFLFGIFESRKNPYLLVNIRLSTETKETETAKSEKKSKVQFFRQRLPQICAEFGIT